MLLHMAADSMTPDAVIATLSAQANPDGRGSEPFDAVKSLHAADDDQFAAIVEHYAAMDQVPMEADVPDGVVLSMT